ncbi:MAG TPA: hypothetical protein VMJ93_07615 [Verrucomicrobiae bacterium]|nr:hypothetical protein [Verrucomicrobiae bacterium]
MSRIGSGGKGTARGKKASAAPKMKLKTAKLLRGVRPVVNHPNPSPVSIPD